ncbi:hypothetical protein GGTG_13871 [Gaeumannomyces tritici R3-111a-1]|uniref:Heterokaryon incompatibility domain-containing protein n=1 Tax=Gaeumannomyces tritici (strain R3-111a-1) TaxID=644352 RepID=J3PK25_GAET3|nr:hypothetical protein GGTG_13871 [Gaeumannomyces tritici R3-111a-1]EJT68558.1 hypothetical protein GGTG_13871 [Gaeumannomyces tritici R3-111a-1]
MCRPETRESPVLSTLPSALCLDRVASPKSHYIVCSPLKQAGLCGSIPHYTQMDPDLREEHTECKHWTSRSSFLPSRLLDVTNPVQLRLVESNRLPESAATTSSSPPYIALSYCWGRVPFPYVTTPENIGVRKTQGFRERVLPRTIRDAVAITRQLGVAYLWVDALCILQGPTPEARKDWEQEARRMHSVYYGAFLTVAAAWAASADQGVFPGPYDVTATGIDVSPRSGRYPELNGIARAGEDRFVEPVSEPLYRRGWTLQERHLSRRLLIYTRDRVSWECQHGQNTENDNHGIALMTGSMRFLTGVTGEELGFRWRELVQDFSGRRISVATDKLPAIAGLARAMQDRTGDTYLAGLWRKTMCSNLLWVHVGFPARRGWGGPRGFPSRYRAPSWSWAAVDGSVNFGPGYSLGWRRAGPQLRRRRLRTGQRRPRVDEDLSCQAKVLGCEVVAAGSTGTFGEISGGYLDIQGPLMDASLLEYHQPSPDFSQDESNGNGGHCQRKTRDSEDGMRPLPRHQAAWRFQLKIFLDGKDGDITSKPLDVPLDLAGVWLLLIQRRIMLVLRRCEEEGAGPEDLPTFKRVGLAVHGRAPYSPMDRKMWFSKFEDKAPPCSAVRRIGIGGVLTKAGPLSLALGYTFWGLLYIWPLNLCVAEMCAYLPIRGSIFELASRFVDPALGFAMGWTYFFASLMLVCTEYPAIATVIRYWDSSTNPAAWIAVAMFSCIIVNLVAVKWYGEAEFIMASTKVLLLFALILITVITMAGGL